MWDFKVVSDFPQSLKYSHVFFHPALIHAWMKTYSQLRNITPIFIKGEADGVEAFMPLVLWKKNWRSAWVSTIIPVGYSDYDYHDPIFSKPISDEMRCQFYVDLIDFLSKHYKYDLLEIDGVMNGMILNETNSQECGSQNHTNWEKGEICPTLDLSALNSEDDLMKFFKTSLRGDIRRQMRRLSEIGELHMQEYDSWETIPSATFESFMLNHSKRWPNAYKAPHFHGNLLKYGLEAGIVHFSVLMVGDIEVAWHLGYEYNNRYYYYMPAGNLEYAKYSPVKVHLFQLVRRAIERGLSIYDHLRGEENYKDGWSNGYHHVMTLKRAGNGFFSKFKNSFNALK